MYNFDWYFGCCQTHFEIIIIIFFFLNQPYFITASHTSDFCFASLKGIIFPCLNTTHSLGWGRGEALRSKGL